MDHNKIDLTQVVDKMAEAAVVGSEDQKTWDNAPDNIKRYIRQSMLNLLLPGCDAFEEAVRAAVADELRALAKNRDRVRPLRLDAETSTDFADDLEWAAMVAEGSAP